MIELKNNKNFKNFFKNIYIYIISIISAVIIIFQAFYTYEKKLKETINVIDYYILLFLSINWIVYGALVDKNSIIFLSVLLLIGSSLFIYLYYIL